MFPSFHCTTSIHRHFSYRRHGNVTSFYLASLNLLSSPGIKSYLPLLTSKLNLLLRPSLPPGTSCPLNFQHVSSSIKICLILMTLFNAILLNQPTEYVLVFNILTDIILLFLVYLKFDCNMNGILIHYIKQHNHFLKLSFDCFITCNVFNITCCIDMDSFSATSKAVIPVVICIVLCLQNETFVYRVQKHFGPGNACCTSTKYLAFLLQFFFSIIYLTYFSGTILLSAILKNVKFISSPFFSIFKYRIFMFFFFLRYLHPILYKNNFSVGINFLPVHVNRHSRQLIYETKFSYIFKEF